MSDVDPRVVEWHELLRDIDREDAEGLPTSSAELKLEAIRQRALAAPITEDIADLRGFVLGITSHRRRRRT